MLILHIHNLVQCIRMFWYICSQISCAKPTWTDITGFVPGQDEPGKGSESAAVEGVVASQPPQVEGGGEVVSSSPVRLQPDSEPEEEEEGAGSSAPGSPAPSEPKRRKKVPDYMSYSLETIFGLKYLNSLMRIRDPGWKHSDPGSGMEKFGSGILDGKKVVSGIRDNIPDPQRWLKFKSLAAVHLCTHEICCF
jgi:hypothetical protein